MHWLQHLSRHCLFLLVCLAASTLAISQDERVSDFFGRHTGTSGHTNNWAVLVCASRYWFNYRHMANALGMYRTVKRLGIPDSNIILMLADDTACNARNKFPGSVYAKAGRHLDLYGDNIEVDYRGYEVTVENFIRLLTGRVDPSVPRSKRLLTDDRSNIFVYMTGHGGNEFLKFQDNEEISAFDIADAFEQMWQKKRYNEIFFMIDTCQANTMYSQFYSPNILATGSSEIGENSYSHENDNDIGVSVIDSYTHWVLEYMEGINKTSQVSMQNLFSSYDPVKIRSHPGVRSDLFQRPLENALITDFFGGVSQAEIFPVIEDADVTVQHTTRISSPDRVVSDPVNPQANHDQDFDKTNTTALVPQKDAVALDARWKHIRKWTSIAIVGFLVGWVSLVR
ncbi:peptidase C13 family-domain-containing protein [Pisolithus croceorrhizus]|nr:peptidase C13 family-domain-containing protein [Pisolithus sp. B1]KAI6124436.1 peptidase C13 family-domain-containing protein [Pisolithus croceorrhizus]